VDNPSPKPQPPKPTDISQPASLIVLLVAMSMIGPLSMHIIVPAVPGLAKQFQADPASVQLTVSLYIMGIAISQLVMGSLSDRFGRRPVLIAGLGLTMLSSIAALFATGILWLIVARILQSLGASAGLVLGRAIIRDLYPRERAAAMMAWVTMAMAVAPMLTPLAGGVLDTAFGWHSIFIAVATASAAVLVWVWFALPETRPEHTSSGGLTQFMADSKFLLTDRSFLGFVLMAALGTATHFAFLGAGPHIVVDIMGYSSATYGAWFILVAFGYLIGNFITARLATRYGIHAIIAAGIAAMWAGVLLSIALLLLYPQAGPWSLFLPQFILSLSSGLMMPNGIAGAISVRPQAAGTASGLVGFIQQGMGAVMAQLMGTLIAGATNAMPISLTALAIGIISVIVYFAWVRPRDRST
jgi:DHA1 family bicyclomycin/chloramphenicol resistance-like MFS transporter